MGVVGDTKFLGATRETSTFATFFRHFSRSQSLTNVQRRSKRRQTIPLDPLDRHGWKPYHHVDGTNVGEDHGSWGTK